MPPQEGESQISVDLSRRMGNEPTYSSIGLVDFCDYGIIEGNVQHAPDSWVARDVLEAVNQQAWVVALVLHPVSRRKHSSVIPM